MEDNRSFLEKITGTKKPQNQEEENVYKMPSSFNFQDEKEDDKPKEIKIEEADIKMEEKSQDSKKKEWLSDETEGQLVLDIYQTENEIVVKSTLAGVNSQDVDITIVNDMLSIKGVREKDENVNPEDYYYQECYWGPFSRSVILPQEVEADQIKASLKNGILTIRLPKAKKIATKKIEVSME